VAASYFRAYASLFPAALRLERRSRRMRAHGRPF
jgi:hypothetical protein